MTVTYEVLTVQPDGSKSLVAELPARRDAEQERATRAAVTRKQDRRTGTQRDHWLNESGREVIIEAVVD